MFEGDKKSALDRLGKSLYSRKRVDALPLRHEVHETEYSVPDSWSEEKSEEKPKGISPAMKKIYKIIFWASLAFFVVALSIGAYMFIGGKNTVSVDNVDILIEGPTSIAGGEPLSLTVSVNNKNTTDMQLVDLIAEYPTGTKDPNDPSKDLSQVRLSLGNISPQSIAQENLNSLMFGQQGELKEIKFTAEYRTADSNAIFYKEKTYQITISSSPVLVSIDALDKVLSGQSSDVTVTISSNTTSPVKNLLLSLDYPFGFTVINSNPSSTYGNSIWRIGDLAPGAKRVITLTGVATGEDGEAKTIHANVGIQSTTNEREIATTIITGDHTFTIEKPFLGLDLVLDGAHSDVASQAGRIVRADLIWTNNSADKITGAKIVAQLSGNVLDKNSISTSDGYYDSISNTITWEAGRTAGLDAISPGENGRVSFNFSSQTATPGSSITDPTMTITVSATGSRIDSTGVPQDITSGVTHSVKLISNLALSSRILRSQGPIQNSGPIPPKVDQATTYTVIWTVTNTSNIITGAQVTATLPAYVKWTGVISPASTNISYNPTGGVITWLVGDVSKNASPESGAKQVAFQISMTPNVSQAGKELDVVSQASISGLDVFTGATIQNNAPGLTTRTATDLLFKSGDEIVQP